MRRDLRQLAALATVAIAACGRAKGADPATGAPSIAASSSPPSATRSEVAKLLDAWIVRATSSAQKVAEQSCTSASYRPAYLDLRRDLASLLIWARLAERMPVEAIYGPEIGFDDDAGALGKLDFFAGVDCDRAALQARQLVSGLSVLRFDLSRHEPSETLIFHGLSNASYRVGELLLFSGAHLPRQDDAVAADLDGTLAGIKSLIAATPGLDGAPLKATIASLAPAQELAATSDGTPSNVGAQRLALVRRTGDLGFEIRRAANARGVAIAPIYRALGDDSGRVHALRLQTSPVALDAARASIGARLFNDRHLSSNGARSCSTCHRPDHAFNDGLPTPLSIVDSHALLRNTPTLLYVANEAALTWDGRFLSASAQALDVVHARDELGLDDVALVASLRSDAALDADFTKVFGAEPTAPSIGAALAAYEATLTLGNTPIDRYARGAIETLDPDISMGLEVFVGKGRCARCHAPPLFAGARPPDFIHASYGVIGVPAVQDGHALDADLGRGARTHRPLENRAFRTPMLRDLVATAPYFHNGSYPTLESVVDFYDKGGGHALGIDLPNQDPDVRPLKLTDEQKRVLLVFLREGLRDPGY